MYNLEKQTCSLCVHLDTLYVLYAANGMNLISSVPAWPAFIENVEMLNTWKNVGKMLKTKYLMSITMMVFMNEI